MTASIVVLLIISALVSQKVFSDVSIWARIVVVPFMAVFILIMVGQAILVTIPLSVPIVLGILKLIH